VRVIRPFDPLDQAHEPAPVAAVVEHHHAVAGDARDVSQDGLPEPGGEPVQEVAAGNDAVALGGDFRQVHQVECLEIDLRELFSCPAEQSLGKIQPNHLVAPPGESGGQDAAACGHVQDRKFRGQPQFGEGGLIARKEVTFDHRVYGRRQVEKIAGSFSLLEKILVSILDRVPVFHPPILAKIKANVKKP